MHVCEYDCKDLACCNYEPANAIFKVTIHESWIHKHS